MSEMKLCFQIQLDKNILLPWKREAKLLTLRFSYILSMTPKLLALGFPVCNHFHCSHHSFFLFQPLKCSNLRVLAPELAS